MPMPETTEILAAPLYTFDGTTVREVLYTGHGCRVWLFTDTSEAAVDAKEGGLHRGGWWHYGPLEKLVKDMPKSVEVKAISPWMADRLIFVALKAAEAERLSRCAA